MGPCFVVVVALALASAGSGQEILFSFNGDSGGDNFGSSVSGAGDVNGDGYADVIVGASHDLNLSGSARVLSGIDGSVLYTFNGFGASVSGAGDVNGDGYADVIVGASRALNHNGLSGSARVLSGIDGSVLHTFNGDSEFDWFGHSVSGAGDVNGDGYADVIVGAWGDDNNGTSSGSARVLSGIDGSVLYTFNGDSADDNFGSSVSGAGDVNGDGYADVIVGAYTSLGARVLSGVDGSVLYTFSGLGGPVSGAGDVNADGHADVIVGAYSSSGSAQVLSGIDGSVLFTFNGDSANDAFGGSVSGAGDVNGDGYADVIVGAPGDDNNGNDSGSARVLSGIDGSVLSTFNGESAEDLFGWSVSGAGDVNGDGYADVVVGAPEPLVVVVVPDTGSAWVFSGKNGLRLGAPRSHPFSSPVTYAVSTNPLRPNIPYFFEISVVGGAPGVTLGYRDFPLAPPYLSVAFGASLPGLFAGFSGYLDANGTAVPTLNIPPEPTLAGLEIYGAALTIDSAAPDGIGISNGVRTTIQ